MKRLPKPPSPEEARAARLAGRSDAVQHRQEERCDPAAAPPEPAMTPETWPVTITWPAGASVAVIAGCWQSRPDGSITAAYHSLAELQWAITLTRWAREWGLNAPGASSLSHQAALFPVPVEVDHYREK